MGRQAPLEKAGAAGETEGIGAVGIKDLKMYERTYMSSLGTEFRPVVLHAAHAGWTGYCSCFIF